MFYSNLIPQKEMFKYKWFKPQNHSKWFYYQPLNLSEPIKIQDSSQIYKTIDPILRDLFLLVTLKGYKTLPSCQGHFHTSEEIKQKYKAITKDLEDIRNDGLVLHGIENKENLIFKDKNYSSAWDSFLDFKDSIEKNMATGYFGILSPKNLKAIKDEQIEIQIDSDSLSEPIAHIIVNNRDEKSLESNWDKIYQYSIDNL